MMSSGTTRDSTHAGSWYTDNARELNNSLANWLHAAGSRQSNSARVIVSPHAGYSYSGSTAAYAFKQINPDLVTVFFILGPSHVMCLNSCALTTCSRYRTPLGDLYIDQRVNEELKETGSFEAMDLHNEESEHSIEMQLPFIAKIMEKQPTSSYSIVPILVGSLSSSRMAEYGKIFAKYLADPRVVFVISSDFCHWGSRFHFTPFDHDTGTPIFEQIATLDRQGMEAISSLDPNVFSEYLKKTQNTICGRNPISVILHAAEYFRQMNNHSAEFVFLKYSQSNQCRNMNDSSVSYAAGALYISPRT